MGRTRAGFLLWSWLPAALLLVSTVSCDPPTGKPDAAVDAGMTDASACTMCGGACVDLSSDPRNCGACGNDCGPAVACMGGRCDSMGTKDMSLLDMSSSDGGMTMRRLCDATPPMGAKLAPAPPVYQGTCPRLVPGKNTIVSSGSSRSFLLAVPSGLMPGEKLPLVFMWHWLGGSADGFLKKGEVQAAVDSQRFLAILPEAKGDITWKWPFDVFVTAARQEVEYRFFDDMLACAAEQFNVNNNCVSSVGVSAGALFTDQLASGRNKYLASAISLSGGVEGVAKPWGNPPRKLPMLVLWGGPMDTCVGLVNFQTSSKALETQLVKDGHFFVECVHNCGHAEPPLEAPAMLSKYGAFWEFVFAHPYWLGTGESPYKTSGLPSGFPSWCGLGAGSAKIRTGVCTEKPGC